MREVQLILSTERPPAPEGMKLMQLKSIQVKITFWSGLCLVLAIAIFVGYAAWSARRAATEAARKEAVARAQVEAGRVRDQLELALNVARTLAQTLVSAIDPESGFKTNREGVNAMIRQVLAEHPQFASLYSGWEPNAFDGRDAEYGSRPGYNPDGRFNGAWSRDENGQIKAEVTPPGDEERADWYQIPKRAMKESIIEPHLYQAKGKTMLETSLVVPIINNGKFYGVVGADIRIDFLQSIAQQVDLYENSGQLILVSNKGVVAGATGRSEAVNKPLQNMFPELAGDLTSIKSGKEVVEFTGDNLKVLVPLLIGKTGTPWSACILVPTAKIMADATALMLRQLGIGLALLIASLAGFWFLAGRIAAPIRAAAQFAERIANGQMTQKIPVSSTDETGHLVAAMNSMLDNAGSLVQSEEKRTQMQQSIITLLNEVSGVAEGDLTREVKVSDDFTATLADSFNFMIAELRRIIGEVQGVTIQVNTSATHTHEMTDQLAFEAELQVTQLSHTADQVSVMTTSVQQVAETAVISERVARQSLDNARQGAAAVQNTIQGMERIREQVDEMSANIERLGATSEEIREIARLITTLANRTGILALNASIQAARAGEAGRGFAVVAREVTKLSESSSEASKRITELVRNIQLTTSEASAAMNRSISEVTTGVSLANQAGQALTEIETVSESLAGLIHSITATAREQADRSEAVSKAMSEISEVTQRTTQGVRQSALTVQELALLADALRASVGSFRLPGQTEARR
jgi:methyl-accepting chemotaxis protein